MLNSAKQKKQDKISSPLGRLGRAPFILSRTDSIGDVILTLPMAGFLKKKYPNCKIYFLCQSYTRPIVECCSYIDEILDWTTLKEKNNLNLSEEARNAEIIHVFPNKQIAKIAKREKIHRRVGTTNRLYHWLYCNVLIRFSRKNSDLHEAQLNLKLIQKHIGKQTIPLEDIQKSFGFTRLASLPESLKKYLHSNKINLILHPKSKGSAQEWGLTNFNRLMDLLSPEKYNILITGTESEGELFRDELSLQKEHVTDLSGKMTLSELFSFIQAADALIACSTGPLHMAAALNKIAIGIYPSHRPMHAGRWAPLGTYVKIVSSKSPGDSLENIPPIEILEALESGIASKFLY